MSLRLSEAGKRLLLFTDDILVKVDDAERDVKKLLNGEAGRLFMVIECHIARRVYKA